MKTFILFIIAVLLIRAYTVSAQDIESDAIMFSTNSNEGTARHVSVGGATSAVGGDITSVSYNPAGIAVYKSSVVVLSPSFEMNKSDAVYNSSSRQEMNTKFNITNFGVVLAFKNSKFSALRSFNMGLAMNTLNSFNQKNEFKQNTTNSITKSWLNEAKTINDTIDASFDYSDFSFETVGAYNTWLVNYDTSLHQYTSPITKGIYQKSNTLRKGNKRDFALSFGANVIDKIFIGAKISIPYINYTSKTTFTEEDKANLNGDFQDFKLTQEYENDGTGINFQIGAIFKPISILRLSAAIQSPTRFDLEQKYTSDFITNFDTISYKNKSPQGEFTYGLNTPWRMNAGIALVHKKLGFVSFDYELVDYTTTNFIFDDEFSDYEDELNAHIKAKYQIAHNFKVGAETKIKNFKIRAGYNLQTSPLKSSYREGNNDFSRQQFSGGIGYLWKKVSLDLAYRYSMQKEFELSFDGVNGIYKDTDSQLIVLSIGFKIGK